MTVPELFPHVKELSHADKLQLLSFLAAELLAEAELSAQNQAASATNELRQSFAAAAILSKALTAHQTANRG